MRLPTAFRYGARAMAQLAAASNQAVSVRELGEQLSISPKYLEQILRRLKAAGLVTAVRGKEGGFVLARQPESITLRELYENLVGTAALVECVDRPESCSIRDTCPTWETWLELKTAIDGVLERTTVQELVERVKNKTISSAENYSI